MFDKELLKKLNDKDMRIYEFIISNKSKISRMSVRDIAEGVSISPASIVRFCKKLGYSGFNEFKYVFKQSMQEEMACDSYDINEIVDCLNKFKLDLYKEKFNEAVEMVKNADSVLFLGIGDSGLIGQYGARKFSSMGKFSTAINDPYYRINVLGDNYVAIALTVSGETVETIRLINECKQQNCKIITITTSMQSTASKMADVTIPYYINRTHLYKQELTSQAPTLVIIENLAKLCILDK